MKINEVFSGNYLKADDLKGSSPRVTISKVDVVEFDDGNKIVVHFQGKEKGLVCNKTNANIIAENVGSQDTDDWAGRTIQLTVKKVEYAGKLVPAIRVVLEDSAPVQQPKRQAPAPARAEAEIPADDGDVDSVPF